MLSSSEQAKGKSSFCHSSKMTKRGYWCCLKTPHDDRSAVTPLNEYPWLVYPPDRGVFKKQRTCCHSLFLSPTLRHFWNGSLHELTVGAHFCGYSWERAAKGKKRGPRRRVFFIAIPEQQQVQIYISTFDKGIWWPGIRVFSQCLYPLVSRLRGRSNSRFSCGSP